MLGIFRTSYSNSISRSTITEVNQKLTLFLTPSPYFYKNNKVPFENLYTPFVDGGCYKQICTSPFCFHLPPTSSPIMTPQFMRILKNTPTPFPAYSTPYYN